MFFKVMHHPTWYTIELVSAQKAADVGCPDATHRIMGKHEITYGRLTDNGHRVKVPNTSQTWGLKCVFRTSDNLVTLDGYLIG